MRLLRRNPDPELGSHEPGSWPLFRQRAILLLGILLLGILLSAAQPCLAVTIVRYAEDVDALTDFYAAFPEVELLTQSATGSRLAMAGTHLWILPAGARMESRGVGRTLLLIPVSNLARADENLISRGIEATPGVENGISFLRFLDPEGYAVGVIESISSSDDGTSPPAPTTPARFRSGHAEMIVTGGLYGIWLSSALPFAFDVDDPQVYGASILLGGSAATYLAHRFARSHHITSGQAGLITVLTHFATSQALGWGALSDAESEDVVLAGALASLGAITTSALIAKEIDISRGQAEVVGSALAWGAWYGLSAGVMADSDELGPPILLGSAAALGLAGLWTAHHDIGVGRTRLVNLGGILGTVAGFGLDLMFEVDDEEGAFILPTLTGLGGLAWASYLTRDQSSTARLGLAPEDAPHFGQLLLARDGQVRVTLWGRSFQ